MRLGKEQAAGYVEDTAGLMDTGSDPIVVQEVTIDFQERMPLTPAPEPVTVVG